MPEPFGTMPDGHPVRAFTLRSDILAVRILEFGAAIQSLEAPDRQGTQANIVLGLSTLDEYRLQSPHFGAVPGRYAGRIANGRFTLDGTTYELPRNDGDNTLHGGPVGFGRRCWTALDHGPHHLLLGLVSADGDQGFPGQLDVTLRYAIEASALHLDFEAKTTAPTVINLTNHTYFNLAGEGSGTALDHHLQMPAQEILEVRPDSIPTGNRLPVAGTPFDFRQPHRIADRIRQAHPQLVLGLGYDHTFLIPGTGLRTAAILHDPASGRRLTVQTTEPTIQLYTANKLTGSLVGSSSRTYRQGDAICLEAQHPPDSPNHPDFPSTTLRPERPYRARTTFAFDVI